MDDTQTNQRRSMLSGAWWVVSAGLKAYARSVKHALDAPGIAQSWSWMRDLQRRTLRPSKAPPSGIRLIEKDYRLDAEATRAWMEAHARAQLAAGLTTEAVVRTWEAASPAAVTAWARQEVWAGRYGACLPIGKAAVCGIAAILSVALVARPGMAAMTGIFFMLLSVFFVIRSIQAIRNQAYLETLTAD